MSTKGGLKKRGVNYEGRNWFGEERGGRNAEEGIVVEEQHFHEKWNVKQQFPLPLLLIRQNWRLQITSYPLEVAKKLGGH